MAVALTATGCGSSVEGTAVASGSDREVSAQSESGSESTESETPKNSPSGASKATDCDALTKVLGKFLTDRPHRVSSVVPGSDDPMCSWSEGPTDLMSTLTASVKPEKTDPEIIEEIKNGPSVKADPRVDKLGGVVLDIVGVAMILPEYSVMVSGFDPEIDPATELDMAIAIAEYLQN